MGETDLAILMSSMQPVLHEDVFAFAALEEGRSMPANLRPIMTFQEAEGLTLILRLDEANEAGLDVVYPCRMVTLQIQSSLEAIGFLAVITSRLAAAGLSVNPVSALHHDHLFVAADRAEEVLELLETLAAESAADAEAAGSEQGSTVESG